MTTLVATSDLLVQATAEAVENWVFLEAQALHSPEAPESVFPITAGIEMGKAGHLRLAVEEPFLRRLAGILYRLESKDVKNEMEMDLLLELLNMIAGRYLSLLAEGGEAVTLGLPVKENLHATSEVLARGVHIHVEEAGRMILYLEERK